MDSEKIQMSFYEQGDEGARPFPISADQWEKKAKEKLAAGPFDYVNGSAGAGDTFRSNLAAFQKYQIRPRICRDITKRDLTIQLFGNDVPVPFLLAPIGVNSILHHEAEIAPAKAAASYGVPYVLSNVSTKSMEDVAEAMGDAMRWFQLYPPKDHELTDSFLKRAEDTGYTAIVVTIDSTLLGWREKDLHNSYLPFLTGEGMGNYFSDPVFRKKLAVPPEEDVKKASKKALDEGNNTSFVWKELEYICDRTKLPVLLKGVTHPEDAVLAIDHGASGLIVSNHGGRQLDGAVATLDCLESVCAAAEHKVPVLLDGGVRRGADVLKAIALEATAVLIGRPYAYALGVAGETGVSEVIKNLIAETELQLGISGRSCINDIDSSFVIKH
ncbi:MAG TPA: alpha-hydroxy-acid oxidizing protein [Bacillales bacterium]|nr:alpha-hydroxy-acid oxidizing protein [Bacillales bacterium]